ncbi:MAG: hypothetical protein E6X23_18685 [Mixta calida]|uniref:hypothetical protein n=1 Tax=Mixta calida TaxID=665913 RepID=UPI00290F677A|nr:hypothetical protein [Mixta calida]MDU4943536.1 hypothetical protein [Mixta calida]
MMKRKMLFSLALLTAGVVTGVQAADDGDAYVHAMQQSGDADVANVLGDINARHKKACGEGYSEEQLRGIAEKSGDYASLLSLYAMDRASYREKLNASFTRCD